MEHDDRKRKVVAAAIAGLIGLAGIAALVKADRDRDLAAGGGGGAGYDERVYDDRAYVDRGYDARGSGLDADGRPIAADTPARRTMDEDLVEADREAERLGGGAGTGEIGAGEVGPATVGPKLVGPKRVGPKIVGAKRVGPKIVGPKRVGPERTTRWHGGGGGHRAPADHIHYPPGWTRTENQRPGGNVER